MSATDAEKFHLRLLLLHVICQWSSLCQFSRCVHPSHLLTDDNQYSKTIAEASNFQMLKQLRSMFATICTYCQHSDALRL